MQQLGRVVDLFSIFYHVEYRVYFVLRYASTAATDLFARNDKDGSNFITIMEIDSTPGDDVKKMYDINIILPLDADKPIELDEKYDDQEYGKTSVSK